MYCPVAEKAPVQQKIRGGFAQVERRHRRIRKRLRDCREDESWHKRDVYMRIGAETRAIDFGSEA